MDVDIDYVKCLLRVLDLEAKNISAFWASSTLAPSRIGKQANHSPVSPELCHRPCLYFQYTIYESLYGSSTLMMLDTC